MSLSRPAYFEPINFGIIKLQGALTILSCTSPLIGVTPLAAKSLLYGCSIALGSTLLLAWRYRQGELARVVVADKVMQQAFRTAVERFAWTAIMMALGFSELKLMPLWMLAGFAAGQATWLFIPLWMKFEKMK